jgi:hypothetical protein
LNFVHQPGDTLRILDTCGSDPREGARTVAAVSGAKFRFPAARDAARRPVPPLLVRANLSR